MSEVLYNVRNRSSGRVVYLIPEMQIRREFAPQETKQLSYKELERLTYQPGGRYILGNYLQVCEQVTKSFNIKTEPEYWMTDSDIVNMLQNGSLDQLLDCLDFAPEGVIGLIKKYSVALPLNDISKISAIKEKTGFDVLAAVEFAKMDKPETSGEVKQRRVAEQPEPVENTRRTASKYKVINQQ